MLLFAGSYERFIFGFSASADCSEPQDIVKRYTFAAHKNGVKCLVAAGPYVASGGADDLIHLYDMKAERDLGVLMNPGDGAVPCLEFYTPEGRSSPSHMLSGSADGGISIWSCRDWEHLKVMRGHKGSVNSVAVHRSGKLALSTARDGAIRMWNLTKGRCTYTAKLDAEAEVVAFSRSGEAYSLICGNKISVHSTAGEGGLLASYTAPRRITCSLPAPSEHLRLLGLEDGSVRVWDVRVREAGGLVGGWERAHGSRVRGMAAMQEGDGPLPTSLATASSDGTIKLWDTRRLAGSLGSGGGSQTGSEAVAPAVCTAEISTNARLTCLAAVDPAAAVAAAAARVKPATAGAAAKQEAARGKAEVEKGKKRSAAGGGEAGGKGKQQLRRPDEGAGKGKQAPPQQQQKQKQQQQHPQQQQRKQQAAANRGPVGRDGRGKGGGRGDDDPGFEVVPAPQYDNAQEYGSGNRDDAEKKPGARRQEQGVAKGQRRGLKRTA
ncbi:hypothetical protein Agub_g1445, partial [Astrephomene gubernaculifera]